MHSNRTPAVTTAPNTLSDDGSGGWGMLLTLLADDQSWECLDCGSIEECQPGEEPPTPQICGTCYNLRLMDLGLSLDVEVTW